MQDDRLSRAAGFQASSSHPVETTAAVARGAQLAAIRARGITLWIGEDRYTARIAATDRAATLGPQDVVVVDLKSSVLPEARSSEACS